jgi:hypothetical protein
MHASNDEYYKEVRGLIERYMNLDKLQKHLPFVHGRRPSLSVLFPNIQVSVPGHTDQIPSDQREEV